MVVHEYLLSQVFLLPATTTVHVGILLHADFRVLSGIFIDAASRVEGKLHATLVLGVFGPSYQLFL